MSGRQDLTSEIDTEFSEADFRSSLNSQHSTRQKADIS